MGKEGKGTAQMRSGALLVIAILAILLVGVKPTSAVNTLVASGKHRVEVIFDYVGLAISYEGGQDRLQSVVRLPFKNWGLKLCIGSYGKPAIYASKGNLMLQVSTDTIWIGVTFRK